MRSPDVFERLRNHWLETGVRLLPPSTEEQIVDAFSRGGRLPVSRDVVRLYSTVGGFRDLTDDETLSHGEFQALSETKREAYFCRISRWDANQLCLWPLGEVAAQNAGYSGPEVCFADYLLHLHFFYLQCVSPDRSVVLGAWDSPESLQAAHQLSEEPMFRCPSLAEFFEAYLCDPERAVLAGASNPTSSPD